MVRGAAITGVNFTATPVPVPVSHSVTLDWTASKSSNIVGYNVYRGGTSGGPYVQIGFRRWNVKRGHQRFFRADLFLCCDGCGLSQQKTPAVDSTNSAHPDTEHASLSG